jgi:chemotaxis protein CheX
METRLVAAFAQAAQRTFKDMFGITATESGARELVGSEDHGWDITGLVGIAGQAQGIVAIRLTQSLVETLLAGSGVATVGAAESRQLESGLVGEMTNIIAGAAITAIRDLDMDIAPPVIVRGINHKIGWPNIAPVMAISFEFPSGSFEVDLCIKH